MKTIFLTKRKSTIVDDEDFEYLNKWKWSFDNLYAVRGHYLGKLNGKDKYRKVYLHREINKTQKGMETDHINKNKLDNRKENLRTVTRGQNGRNHNAHRNNIVGICGVVWNKQNNKYRATIGFNKKRIHLGYFSNIRDAIIARKKGEQRLWDMI